MPAERSHQLHALVEAALEIPGDQRLTWLDDQESIAKEIRAEAREMLDIGREAEDFLEVPALDSWLEQQRASQGELSPGTRLGPYQVERFLGHGGMGYVVLASRDDEEFRQRVAIKIADSASSPEALRRFRLERQILSDLDHPNIARLLDGGSTALGRPYLVMEHIEGEPIHTYCDDLRQQECLILLRKVLAAVAYAHRHLVMHLDLKPANILVNRHGEPKLLDFGIAKLLAPSEDDATLTTDRRPLTPEYASPEQLRGERLSTASDVYSIGLLLHRLLTGTLPSRLGCDGRLESEKAVDVAESGLPTGDLEAIARKALRHDPAERYASVEQLDDDLRRHLEGEPILARLPTWHYRAGRFAKRHWLILSLVSALFFITVVAAVALSLQAQRIEGERARAELAGAEAEDVASFMIDLLGRFDPGELKGSTLTVPDVLDRGREALGQLAQRPAVRARLLDALGTAYRGWGQFGSAEPLLEEALQIRRELSGNSDQVAASLNSLGRLAREQGDFEEAMAAHREALDLLRSEHGDDHLAVADTLQWMANIAYDQTELRTALALYHRAHVIHRRHLGDRHPQIVADLRNLAKVRSFLDHRDNAIRFATTAIDIANLLWPQGHLLTAETLNILGVALTYNDRGDEGVAAIRKAVEMKKQYLGDDHPQVVQTTNDLGVILLYQGRSAEAVSILGPNFELLESIFGPDHQNTAMAAHNLGQALFAERRLHEAEGLLRQSLEIMRRTQPDNDGIYHPLGQLAEVLMDDERCQEALPLAKEALARARRTLGSDRSVLSYYEELVGRCSSELERPAP